MTTVSGGDTLEPTDKGEPRTPPLRTSAELTSRKAATGVQYHLPVTQLGIAGRQGGDAKWALRTVGRT